MLEDKVLDLQIIFASLKDTVVRITERCKDFCRENCSRNNSKLSSIEVCNCLAIIEDFGGLLSAINLYEHKSETLYKRAQGATQLARTCCQNVTLDSLR